MSMFDSLFINDCAPLCYILLGIVSRIFEEIASECCGNSQFVTSVVLYRRGVTFDPHEAYIMAAIDT